MRLRDVLEPRRLAMVQGVAYVLGGVWPLVHLRSFEAIFGPKEDDWLVKTVSLMLVAVGATEIVAARRDEVTTQTAVLGAGTAAALGAIDAVYVPAGRIRPTYLLDGAMEAAFVAAWGVAAGSVRADGVER